MLRTSRQRFELKQLIEFARQVLKARALKEKRVGKKRKASFECKAIITFTNKKASSLRFCRQTDTAKSTQFALLIIYIYTF